MNRVVRTVPRRIQSTTTFNGASHALDWDSAEPVPGAHDQYSGEDAEPVQSDHRTVPSLIGGRRPLNAVRQRPMHHAREIHLRTSEEGCEAMSVILGKWSVFGTAPQPVAGNRRHVIWFETPDQIISASGSAGSDKGIEAWRLEEADFSISAWAASTGSDAPSCTRRTANT